MRNKFKDECLELPYIIMDSSVIELGQPMGMDDILDAAAVVKADCIVLPDIIGDQQGTNKLVEEFADQVHNLDTKGNCSFSDYSYMFVPQGKSLPEYTASLEFASQFDFITWVGLPRDALKFDVSSRRQLIDITNVLMPECCIHLLGFSDDLMDDVLSSKYAPNVVGIDSAVPVRAGQRHIELMLSRGDYGKRKDFWDNPGELTRQAIINCQRFRNFIEV
jgi:hypothetical protein